MFLDDKVQNLDTWDVGLIKLSVAAFVLFVLTIWSAANSWVQSVSPWIFLVLFVVIAIRPFYRAYLK